MSNFRGTFICEYVGEIINFDEAEKRGSYYSDIGRSYLFDLDFHMQEKPYTIDAFVYGNISRFLNHSCSPNCQIWPVHWDCMDENFPRLAVFANRAIKANEELTFDYSGGAMNVEASDEGKVKFMECKCGAANCKKILYT